MQLSPEIDHEKMSKICGCFGLISTLKKHTYNYVFEKLYFLSENP